MTIEAAAGPPPASVRSTTTRRSAGSSTSSLLFVFVVWVGYEFWANARDNLRAAIQTGFGFLDTPPARHQPDPHSLRRAGHVRPRLLSTCRVTTR